MKSKPFLGSLLLSTTSKDAFLVILSNLFIAYATTEFWSILQHWQLANMFKYVFILYKLVFLQHREPQHPSWSTQVLLAYSFRLDEKIISLL